jgi:hypothetical protein
MAKAEICDIGFGFIDGTFPSEDRTITKKKLAYVL